ncbi:SNF2 family N-terminal domain-containing protein [Apiospora arundinis]|uniref:SNF2 family N-terminal domain-containing protein n=1 Tax=Apiospora arundinis TaxID=335852 RepID=A0ABR2IVT8_9PEZI
MDLNRLLNSEGHVGFLHPNATSADFASQSMTFEGNVDLVADGTGAIDRVENGQSQLTVGDVHNCGNEEALDDVDRQRGTKSSITCFGMLHQYTATLAQLDMKTLAMKLTSSSSPHNKTNTFAIRHSGERIALLLQDGSDFAYLQKQFIKPFSQLRQVTQDIEFEAVGVTADILKNIHNASKLREARCVVDINVYGPRERAEAIGNTLMKYELWLQRPDNYRSGFVSYMNPHAIRFPDLEEQIAIEGSTMVEDPSPVLQQSEENALSQYMSEVHDGLSRDKVLGMDSGGQLITTRLLPHQGRALKYMRQRESGDIPSEFRLWKETEIGGRKMFVHQVTGSRSVTQPEERGGGVLADEMGTGKSLSTLALIAQTLDLGREWLQERQSNPNLEVKTKHYAAATLIIVPSAQLIANWANEIQSHAGNTLRTLQYHGTGREKDPKALMDYDVVLTTYSTLSADYSKAESMLHRILWYRIVLDEAHYIRNHLTTFYRACCDLEAHSRWCLSGTPIQNRLEDIGSLFSFLRVEPLHSRAEFRRSICLPFENHNKALARDRLIMVYDSLVLRRSKDTCIQDVLDPEEELRQLQFSPEEKEQYARTLQILKRRLLNQAYVHPGQTTTLGNGSDPGLFRIDGNDFRKTQLYHSLVDENASRFSLFHAMMQLRILCNHGTYQNWFSWKKHKEPSDGLEEREASLVNTNSPRSRLCDGCNNPLAFLDLKRTTGFGTPCPHVLCVTCLDESKDTSIPGDASSQCPLCRRFASTFVDEVQQASTEDDGDVIMTEDGNDLAGVPEDSSSTDSSHYFRGNGTSTKVNALMEDMRKDPPGTKSIIFSCWTRTLDLIQRCMKENNVFPLRIDGNSPLSERRKVIDSFENDSRIQVLLMTTGTGAHGLNLTAANRIFIFELQWNPSIERQAIARAIRIGQTRQVRVTRYLIEDTVEQAIYQQQNKKRAAAAVGFP